jgi:hypothetical protein
MTDFNVGDCVYNTNVQGNLTYGGGGDSPWTAGPLKVVTEHVGLAHAYASQAFDNSWCFLTALAQYSPTLNNLSYNVNFDEITAPTPNFNTPTAPTAPIISLVLPTFPETFVPGDIHEFDENAIGTLPTFTDAAPTINLPATPGALDVEAPGDSPDITTDFIFPDSPTVSLPTVPTFEELSLPSAPNIDLPSFSMDIPAIPATLNPPGLIFQFTEEEYSSSLMTALTNELMGRIQNGGTGLNPAIEQAIWDRARNREDQNAVRSENQVKVEQAAQGFSRPQGSHFAALDQLAQETQNKNADLSREIAIKQAELEQRNIEFAMQTSLSLEQSWLQYHNQVQQRAFEAEKFVQQTALDLYEADIKKFGLQLDVYKTYSQAFESRVKAELAKAEVFRTELEAQKLIGDINQQKVALYEAQLSGIRTSVDIYTAEVGAVKSQIEAEALKIQNFRSLVEVYSAQVASKKSEYDMYTAAVEGEMAKINIYDSKIKAFVSRVEAYSKQVDTETKRIDSDIQVEGLRLKDYLSKLEAAVQQSKVQATISSAKVDAFRGEADLYRSRIDAETSRVDAESKVYDLEIQKARYIAEVELKNAEVNLENAKNSVALILESIKSGAQVGSSLAASSLSAMSIGANISGSSQSIHTYQEK